MTIPQIRPVDGAHHDEQDALWRILEPIIRAGETYPVPRDATRDEVMRYWLQDAHEVFVAEEEGRLVGTYYLKANQGGPGSHVANCGYMVLPSEEGRGIGRALCVHSLDRARERGFRAMQFNLVVSTNGRAAHLWESCGFEVLCRLPGAFEHPRAGFVDAFVMWREL